MKIVIHNLERVTEVIECREPTVCTENRVQWEGGDICAPFHLVSDEVDVSPGDPVENIAGQCRKHEWRMIDPQTVRELMARIEALEKGEREEA